MEPEVENAIDQSDAHDDALDLETEETEEPEQDSEEQEEPKFKVKVGGKEQELPLSQLIENAQKGMDYTQKTQALAEQRKAQDEVFQRLSTTFTEVDQLYGILTEVSKAPFMSEQELLQLALTDPQRAQRIEIEQRIHKNQIEQVRQAQLAAKQKQAQIALHYGQQYLKDNAPHLLDQTIHKNIADYLTGTGYSHAELNELYDPRALIIAEKAMRYDEMVKKREEVRSGVKPKGEKVLQPNGQAPKPAQRKISDQEKARLRRTGSLRDAAPVFNRLVKK